VGQSEELTPDLFSYNNTALRTKVEMKNSYWGAVAMGALIIGVLIGYGIWGVKAARLADAEKDLAAAQSQTSDFKKKMGDLENNLGKITNEKLNLEKERAELEQELEKTSKKPR
jgi:peptidoglycan hydrolase CwlO-like protein